MSDFCPLHDVCDKIKAIDGTKVTFMNPAVEARICAELTAGKYTRLMISAGVGFEEFKVTCANNCVMLDSEPFTKFSSGDTIWYESCSKANLADLMACINEEAAAETEADSSFKILGFVKQIDNDGAECWVPDPANKQGVEFQVGKQIIKIDGTGCATSTDAPVGSYPTEGVFTNATVTIGANCLPTGLKDGVKPVCNCNGCCCGTKDTEAITDAGVV